jgi:hypothetical protein
LQYFKCGVDISVSHVRGQMLLRGVECNTPKYFLCVGKSKVVKGLSVVSIGGKKIIRRSHGRSEATDA